MKHYTTKSCIFDSTDYNSSLCVVDDEGNYIVTPFFYWDEDSDDHEITGYAAFVEDNDEPVEFASEEELDKFMEDYAEKLNAAERSKWVCLKRNAKRRLKKELASWVKANANMMGWTVKFFRNACLLAVSHYEVSIDEVMDKELMFNV